MYYSLAAVMQEQPVQAVMSFGMQDGLLFLRTNLPNYYLVPIGTYLPSNYCIYSKKGGE